MAKTFVLGSTNSDLTGGADFDRYLEEAPEGASTVSPAVGAGATEISHAFTRAGVPGISGATGNYTVEVNVTSANSNIFLAIQIHRVNSSGTIQTSGGTTAEQQLSTTGVKNFSLTSQNLGTWASGDRLRVDYRFRSAAAHGNNSVNLETGTTNTEHVTPFVSTIIQTVGQVTSASTANTITPHKTKTIGQVTSASQAFVISAPRVQPVNQVAESDTLFTVTWNPKIRQIGQVSVSSVAQAISRDPVARLVNFASESDTLGAITLAKSAAIGQISEADTPSTVAHTKALGLVQVTETDTSQTASGSKTATIGQVSSVAETQQISIPSSTTIGQVTEVDTPATLSWSPKERLLGSASASSAALIIVPEKIREIALSAENDTNQGLTPIKSLPVAQVLESANAPATSSAKARGIVQVNEADTSQALIRPLVRLLQDSAETDLAQLIGSGGLKTISVNQATESNTPFTITWTPKTRQIVQVAEVDQVQGLGHFKVKGFAQIAEEDTAQLIRRNPVSIVLAQVATAAVAQAIAESQAYIVGQTGDSEFAQGLLHRKRLSIGQAAETSLAQAVGSAISVLLATSSETGTVEGVASFKVRTVGQAEETDLVQVIVTPRTIQVQQIAETELARDIVSALVSNLIPDPRFICYGHSRDYAAASASTGARTFVTDKSRDFYSVRS